MPVNYLLRLSSAIAGFSLLACILSGCGSSSSDGGSGGRGELVTSTHQYQSLQFSLTTLNIVRSGEEVPISFTVKNTGSLRFEMFTGLPEATIQVCQGESEIWNPYYGRAFPALAYQFILPPGEAKSYPFSWSQRDNSGNQVATGSYTVKATFNGISEQLTLRIE